MTEPATHSAADTTVIVPQELFDIAAESIGAFFEPISRIDRHTGARDFLDLARASKRAGILQRYTPLDSKKLLEVGSGFGTNLAVWINQGPLASRKHFAANLIDRW